MAYKFQLGAFVASGSLTQEGNIVGEGNLKLSNSGEIGCVADDDLITLANQSVAFANDVDVNIAKAGGLQIGGTAVTSTATELNALDGFGDAGYDATADSVVFFDATDNKLKREAANDFAGAIAGDGLGASSGALSVQVSGALKIASDKVGITGSFAGVGLEAGANEGIDSMNTINIDLTNVSALGGTGLHQTQDHFMFSDNGSIKKITFSNLEDAIFGNVSGDIAIAAGGAVTIQANAVEDGMVNDNVATGLAGTGLAASSGVLSLDLDEVGTGHAVNVGQDSFVFADGGDDATKRDTFVNLAAGFAGNGLAASSGVIAVAVSGALKIASDKVGITGSFAGVGLEAGANEGVDSMNTINIDLTNVSALGGTGLHQSQDHFMFSDNGTIKKITFSNLEDAIFGNVSGDIAVAAGGAATIQANAVEGSMLNNNVISGLTDIGGALATTDELMVSDNGTLRRMDLSRLSTMMQGTGLDDSSGQLAVSAAQTSITSIINSSMGKIGTAADQEYIDFGTSNEIKFVVNNSAVASVEAGVFVVAGDLRVNGTTTTINSTTVNITSSLIFEGPADAHETTFGIVDPTADATINLPAMSAGTYFVPVLSAATTTAIDATPAELNLLDGGTAVGSSVTIADSDGIILDDAGTMKKIPASDLVDYIAGLNVQNVDNAGTLEVGFNYFSDLGGAESATLPASPTVGNVVYVKAPSNCSVTNTVTINKAGSQTIDGQTSLVLESPFAAVSLCYVANNLWRVF